MTGPKIALRPPPRQRQSREPWTREQESITCERCGALPDHECVTASGAAAPLPHAYRFRAAQDRERESTATLPKRKEGLDGRVG